MNIPTPTDLKGYALVLSNLGLPFVFTVFVLVIAWRGVDLKLGQLAKEFDLKLQERGYLVTGTARWSKDGEGDIIEIDMELVKTNYKKID